MIYLFVNVECYVKLYSRTDSQKLRFHCVACYSLPVAVCYVDSSSVDFMADAKRIQQNYLKRSSSGGEQSNQPGPPAASAASQAPSSGTNPHPAATMLISRPGPVAVPASTNGMKTLPSSGTSAVLTRAPAVRDASTQPGPVTSSPQSRNVVVKPQSTSFAQSNSVVFRAAARTTRDPATSKTVDSPTRL